MKSRVLKQLVVHTFKEERQLKFALSKSLIVRSVKSDPALLRMGIKMLKSDVEGSCCHITPVNGREASKASKQTQSSTLIHIHATSE